MSSSGGGISQYIGGKAAAVVAAVAIAAGAVAVPVITGGSGGQSCPALPSFPDANCTGVPSGETLTTVSGPVDLTTNGQTYANKNVTGDCINVKAANVTIRNVKAKCINSQDGGSATVIDTEVAGGGVDGAGRFGYCVIGSDLDMTRVDINGCENGIGAIADISLTDSYIHDLYAGNGGDGQPVHADGIETECPDPGPLTVQHTNIVFQPPGSPQHETSIINICNESGGSAHDVTVNESRLDASTTNFAIYCPRFSGWSNIVITDNRIAPGSAGDDNPATPGYGNSCSGFVTTWSGNVDDSTGATVNAGD